MLAAGLFLTWYAYDSADGNLALDGPWLAPLVVTSGWLALALWYLVRQFVAPDRPIQPSGAGPTDADTDGTAADDDPGTGDGTAADDDPGTGDGTAADDDPGAEDDVPTRPAPVEVQWLPPVLLAAALCGYVFALEPLGFVLATVVFFVLTARILGSRQLVRDLVVAIPLALAVYLSFTQLLAIGLPSGVLPI